MTPQIAPSAPNHTGVGFLGAVRLLTAAPLTLTLTADQAGINASPREALTDEIRALIREHKPALVVGLRHAAGTGVPWHGGEGAGLLATLGVDLTAWAALEPTAGPVTADLLGQAQFAVLVRDLAALTDVVAAYQELHNAWCDGIWPLMPITTPAIAWACSRWQSDPLTLEYKPSTNHYVFDDEEAV